MQRFYPQTKQLILELLSEKKNTYLDGVWKNYIDFMEEKHTQILSLKRLKSMT